MSKIDYQELREKAEKATCGVWSLEYGNGRFDGDDALIHREVVGYIPICRIEGAHPESGFDEDFQMEQQANAEFIAAANPATVLALLDERERNQQYIKRRDQENEDIALTVGKLRVELEGKDKLIAELRKQCAEWERKALSNFEECAAMAERIEELQTKSAPDSFGIIGENIRTQDNRITSDPMFCVYQKREIVVDADYDYDRIVWVDEDGNEANKRQSRRLELLHENFREPPEKWRRVAVKDIDEFVTCCFTEQGCKDYLAVNGHNLRLPFIYVKSGFRNAEYIGIRNWLAGIRIKGE
ncbi:TPA: ead/Ea22-like family protein [Escherichia coli]|uniref:ead/Ea22-like family protein n=2 Tax=Enterobacteriaceae TaxID=543 RepID=UPI0010FEF01B|nr:ead/Ea22-like family protein [Escherichia coli]NPP32023.1 ead/Ea22-like family protein [Escherichia coli]TLI50724.1 ead/Ea22-like family protein [Escherichia coli O25b:H4]HAG8227835.1 ead/Ea22-like family protein [Escherichia coli]HAJ3030762.1 ead/Ea22-like family protein [Escherichia coli]HAN6751313.1 ead/Ea22-like family protein [Escherichia coli]